MFLFNFFNFYYYSSYYLAVECGDKHKSVLIYREFQSVDALYGPVCVYVCVTY